MISRGNGTRNKTGPAIRHAKLEVSLPAEAGNPVSTVATKKARPMLLDRPAKPGDDTFVSWRLCVNPRTGEDGRRPDTKNQRRKAVKLSVARPDPSADSQTCDCGLSTCRPRYMPVLRSM